MKLVRLMVALALLGAAGYGLKTAWESQALRLEKVEVVGNTRIEGATLVSASGLRSGSHLLKLSVDSVSKRVGRIPWVSHARVERILPSKIRITVTERKPFVAVVSEGKTFLVASDATVLEENDAEIPHVTDMPITGINAGSQIELAEFSHLTRVVEALPQDLRAKVTVVKAPSVDRITLELSTGLVVIFGAAEEIEDKIHAVQALIARYEERGASLGSIDVRVPSRPAVRPL